MHVLTNWIQRIFKLAGLLSLIILLASCAGTTSYHDLIPQSGTPNNNTSAPKGTISVHGNVTRFDTGQYQVRVSYWVDSRKFTDALEIAIANNGFFLPVKNGQQDYVLDVWVDKVNSSLQVFGEGFIIDMKSVWRLTRIKDGKVVACDFVHGHGAAHAVAERAHKLALEKATQETLKKGLLVLSDKSRPHMSAMSDYGDRPSMGPVELLRFKQAVAAGTSEALQDFLQAYPASLHSDKIVALLTAKVDPKTREEYEHAAEQAATKWIVLVDGGKWSEAWVLTSGSFQLVNGSIGQFAAGMQSARSVGSGIWAMNKSGMFEEVGEQKQLKVISRTVKSSIYSSKVGMRPLGDYVVVRYKTLLAQNIEAEEAVLLAKTSDSKWVNDGYCILMGTKKIFNNYNGEQRKIKIENLDSDCFVRKSNERGLLTSQSNRLSRLLAR